MRHFVTGATGLLGRRLCKALAEAGDSVVAFCRKPEQFDIQHPSIRPVAGDVTDIDSLRNGIAGCDTCFHLAALAKQWHQDPSAFDRVNVRGTVNVMNAAAGVNVRRFVFTSTAGVYGASADDRDIDETSGPLTELPTEYERSKSLAQRLVATEAAGGFPAVIVNPTRVFGPGPMNESNSLAMIVARYRDGRWRFKPGAGDATGNYVFLDDVVNGHISAMKEGRIGEAYILGGENLSFNELFELIGDVVGRKQKLYSVPLWILKLYAHLQMLKARVLNSAPRLTPPFIDKYSRNYRLSSKKAQSELGYQITPVRIAIERTIEGLSRRQS